MKIRIAFCLTSLACLLALPARSQQRDSGTTHASLHAPGACVPVPTATWYIRREITQSSPPDPSYPFVHNDQVSMSVTQPFDLDGDGHLDSLVPEPVRDDCVQTFHSAIYITRGTCGHRVGVVQGSLDITHLATAPRNAGLPDLTTLTEQQHQSDPRTPARLRRETRTYRFDGTAYREVNNVVSEGECYHCPSQHCEDSTTP